MKSLQLNRSTTYLPNAMAVVILAIGLASFDLPTAEAQFRLFGRNRVQQEQVSYELTDKSGPWLVMCASFDGSDGQQDATRLAEELRTQFGLKTYVYQQSYDFDQLYEDQGLGYSAPKQGGEDNVPKRKMRLYNGQDKKTEFAVLVGDFSSIDSAAAQKTLAQIKELKPQSMNHFSESIENSTQSGARIRAQSDALYGSRKSSDWSTLSNQARGTDQPLRFAFLLANPALPEEYFAVNQIDQYVMKLNDGLPNSLLNCEGIYTVKIASFAGKSYLKESEIEQLKNQKPSDSLMISEQRANILTSYLRKMGVEAYEFHDRYESYVCVGSFDWWKKGEGADATVNPEISAVIEKFQGKPRENGVVGGYPLPSKLIIAGITCDADPLPVIVPKVEVRRAGIKRFFK